MEINKLFYFEPEILIKFDKSHEGEAILENLCLATFIVAKFIPQSGVEDCMHIFTSSNNCFKASKEVNTVLYK